MEAIKVVFFTEGSQKIGFGHITRCISIYQAFSEKRIVPEIVVKGDNSIKYLLKSTNFTFLDWLELSVKLREKLKDSDIVIIDSYLAPKTFYDFISENTSVPVYLDDNYRVDYPCGIIVNGNIHAKDLGYNTKEGSLFLLGTRYTPLRKPFWQTPDREVKEHLDSIMVTFGGDDIRNLTPKVLRLLANEFSGIRKTVVVGRGFKNIEEIKAAADTNTDLFYYPDAEEMKQLMLCSDLAISAGGQTIYELARTGTPTIAIVVAENQVFSVNKWKETGFIEYAGSWNSKSLLTRLKESIIRLENKSLRKAMSDIGRSLVSGDGAMNIVSSCLKYFLKKHLTVRKVSPADIDKIYLLSNDPYVRKNSFNERLIDYNSHKEWFFNTLRSKNCLFLVAELKGCFAGQLRYEIQHDIATISISINKELRGLGIGEVFVEKSLSFLKGENPVVKSINAYVKEGNLASIRLFEKLGFCFIRKSTYKNCKALEYTKRL